MNDSTSSSEDATAEFRARWEASGAAERANYALFLTQLCDLLAVPQPDPTTVDFEQNAYVFERDVTFDQGDVSPGHFGTLLERAFDPVERQKLGAHYALRAYVERLVMPTAGGACDVAGADRLGRLDFAAGAKVPLQVADPEHQI